MDMTNPDFYALYHSAWKLSFNKAKEAERQAKLEEEQRKQEAKNNRAAMQPPISNMQRMQAALGGVNPSDFQEMIEELE